MKKYDKDIKNPFWINPHVHPLLTKSWVYGAPKHIILVKPFFLPDHIRTITYMNNNRILNISKQTQEKIYKRIHSNPFYSPYCMVISSNPNDGRAKLVALNLFLRAIEKSLTHVPHWHILTGDFREPLREKQDFNFLVLTNIPSNMTNQKVEKLRDLLEIYSDIPRVLVTTGVDPITFANQIIQYRVNSVIYLPSTFQTITI